MVECGGSDAKDGVQDPSLDVPLDSSNHSVKDNNAGELIPVEEVLRPPHDDLLQTSPSHFPRGETDKSL